MKDYNSINWDNFVYYDETSPSCLRWKVGMANNKFKPDDVAGSLMGTGYHSLRVDYTAWLCHRIVWVLHGGEIDDLFVDHIDGNPLNNRIENLRAATKRENCQNQKKSSKNTTGVVGVYLEGSLRKYQYFVAQWKDHLTGKNMRQLFSINTYGHDVAFDMACKIRSEMILAQIQAGAKYTDRHGT